MGFPFALLLPTLGPAIAGSVIYGVLLPILIWRTHTTHRFSPYIMLTIFSIFRCAGFACRAAWSQQLDQGITALVYVANILQFVGFILEIFAVINLTINWINASLHQGSKPPTTEKLAFIALRILIIAAQIMTIIGAVMLLVGAGSGKLDLVTTGTNLRNASYYAFFAGAILGLCVLHFYYFTNSSRARIADYLLILVLYLLLLFKLCFRIAALNMPAIHDVNTKEVFYFCIDALPELLICLIAVVVNLSRVKNGFEPWNAKREQERKLSDTKEMV
ncbi:hypothetical protein INT43_004577 [Umbelopsis isabellina]|uniref:Uncharacterized protein n=1 Tax=Mortierella isabellina TaxID=91625 RepID=A0A8H7PG25_MORIS|nr:hypothetical protein INT43_004577 [Umbelopsis isabellina]